jgi:cell division septum initiation protein DivIVA
VIDREAMSQHSKQVLDCTVSQGCSQMHSMANKPSWATSATKHEHRCNQAPAQVQQSMSTRATKHEHKGLHKRLYKADQATDSVSDRDIQTPWPTQDTPRASTHSHMTHSLW